MSLHDVSNKIGTDFKFQPVHQKSLKIVIYTMLNYIIYLLFFILDKPMNKIHNLILNIDINDIISINLINIQYFNIKIFVI